MLLIIIKLLYSVNRTRIARAELPGSVNLRRLLRVDRESAPCWFLDRNGCDAAAKAANSSIDNKFIDSVGLNFSSEFFRE
jgi:hypothetical protein